MPGGRRTDILRAMPEIPLTQRVSRLRPSATLGVAARAKALRAEGVDLVAFAAGQPDFDTPDAIKEAAIEALRAGETKYVSGLGDQPTREVIADKMVRRNRLPDLTWRHVSVHVGAKHAIFSVLQCLVERPEDEVILPVPAWVSYAPMIEIAGGRVVPVETTLEDGFRMSPEALRAAITPRTRALILNSPSNPCGTMYGPEALEGIAAVVADAAGSVAPNLVLLTDEIYESITYGEVPHMSIGSLPAVADRTVTVSGLSKSYAMTGWRAGYAACPGEFGLSLMGGLSKLQDQMTSNITSFIYPAIRTALTECDDFVEYARGLFAARAALIQRRLDEIQGLRYARPQGAFYVFPEIASFYGGTTPHGRTIDSAQALAEALLEEARVALVPGEDFGGCGARHVRLSFACSEDQISEGMDRIAAFLEELRRGRAG